MRGIYKETKGLHNRRPMRGAQSKEANERYHDLGQFGKLFSKGINIKNALLNMATMFNVYPYI